MAIFIWTATRKLTGWWRIHYLSIKPGLKHSPTQVGRMTKYFAFISSYLAHAVAARVQVTFGYTEWRAGEGIIHIAIDCSFPALHHQLPLLLWRIRYGKVCGSAGWGGACNVTSVGYRMWFLSWPDEQGCRVRGDTVCAILTKWAGAIPAFYSFFFLFGLFFTVVPLFAIWIIVLIPLDLRTVSEFTRRKFRCHIPQQISPR